MRTITQKGVTYNCPLSEKFRRHFPEELDAMRSSIRDNGVLNTIRLYYDTTLNLPNCVLDGEGRLSLAAEVDLDRVPLHDQGRLTTEEAYYLA